MCENLKFWRTDLSHAQTNNRGEVMRLLEKDANPSLEILFWRNILKL
jgi:hypothetical protein